MLTLVYGLLIMLAPVPDNPEPNRFTFTLKKKDDTAKYLAPARDPYFQIQSASGIGSVTIQRTAGQWPDPLVVRFAGMKMLESFQFQAEGIRLEGHINAEEKIKKFHFDREGKIIEGEGKFAWTLVISRREDGMEVVVSPGTAVKPLKEISLNWIDAYRR